MSEVLKGSAFAAQCRDAAAKLQKNNEEINSAKNTVSNFNSSQKLKGVAVEGLTQQLEDYTNVFSRQINANDVDIEDSNFVAGAVDGININKTERLEDIETDRQQKQSYENYASVWKVIAAGNAVIGREELSETAYKMVRMYEDCAQNCQDSITKNEELCDKYDSAASAISGKFAAGPILREEIALFTEEIAGAYNGATKGFYHRPVVCPPDLHNKLKYLDLIRAGYATVGEDGSVIIDEARVQEYCQKPIEDMTEAEKAVWDALVQYMGECDVLDDINVDLVNLVLKSCTEEVGGPVTYGGHYEYNDKIENIVEQLAAQLKEGVTDDKATNYTMWGTLCSLSEAGNTLYSVPEISVIIPGPEDKWGPKIEITAGTSVDWTGGNSVHAVLNISTITVCQAVKISEGEKQSVKDWKLVNHNIGNVAIEKIEKSVDNGATERSVISTAVSIVVGGASSGAGAAISVAAVVDGIESSNRQTKDLKKMKENETDLYDDVIEELGTSEATGDWVTIIGDEGNDYEKIKITEEGEVYELGK